MITLNALKLLKYCSCHDETMYNTYNIKVDNLSTERIQNACELLIEKGYFELLDRSIDGNIQFVAKPKAKEYKAYIKLSIIEFVAKSILVPIIVALATAVFSNNVDQKNLNITITIMTPSNATSAATATLKSVNNGIEP